MKPKYNNWLLLFFVFCLLNILAEAIQNTYLIFATKPLLLTFLSIYFYKITKSNPSQFRRYIFLGLLLSIAGDTTLMFVENPPHWQHFFLLGLGSFLMTHIFYLLAFFKYPSKAKGLLQKIPLLAIPFLFFLIGNNLLLWEGIENAMKIPVVIYSLAIVLMALFCLNLKTKMQSAAWQWLFLGVLLFVISDTFIGLNKFRTEIPYARLLIMTPYLLGQYFIVKGSIQANQDIE